MGPSTSQVGSVFEPCDAISSKHNTLGLGLPSHPSENQALCKFYFEGCFPPFYCLFCCPSNVYGVANPVLCKLFLSDKKCFFISQEILSTMAKRGLMFDKLSYLTIAQCAVCTVCFPSNPTSYRYSQKSMS